MIWQLPLYVDIDGTLTSRPIDMWGPVFWDRIRKLRAIIADGQEVVLWTGGGTDYAKEFAEEYGLQGAVCIGKPGVIVDDNPTIRPSGRMAIIEPQRFFDSITVK